MIDPITLNLLQVEDALVYALDVRTSTQTALLRIGIDTTFHRGLTELGIEATGEALVEFVFFGVRSIAFAGLRPRPTEWLADEKPHDYEIATFEVKKPKLGRASYVLYLQCQLGQSCRIEFAGVAVQKSDVPPAETHVYN